MADESKGGSLSPNYELFNRRSSVVNKQGEKGNFRGFELISDKPYAKYQFGDTLTKVPLDRVPISIKLDSPIQDEAKESASVEPALPKEFTDLERSQFSTINQLLTHGLMSADMLVKKGLKKLSSADKEPNKRAFGLLVRPSVDEYTQSIEGLFYEGADSVFPVLMEREGEVSVTQERNTDWYHDDDVYDSMQNLKEERAMGSVLVVFPISVLAFSGARLYYDRSNLQIGPTSNLPHYPLVTIEGVVTPKLFSHVFMPQALSEKYGSYLNTSNLSPDCNVVGVDNTHVNSGSENIEGLIVPNYVDGIRQITKSATEPFFISGVRLPIEADFNADKLAQMRRG